MDKKSILIVEDEAIVAEDLRRCLEKLGYNVAAAVASGEQALAQIQKHKPDLVLMDIVLEGELNGIDTAGFIHRQEQIPVVYLTAYSDPPTLERAKLSEPYGYVLKPFDERELHSVIEIALYKHQAEKRLHHLNGILRAIRNVNQLIVQEKDRKQLIEKACRLLTEGRGYFNAYIALMDEEARLTAEAAAGVDIEAIGHARQSQPGLLPACMLRAWEQAELLVIEDRIAECTDCPLYNRGDKGGTLVTPLVHQGHKYGVLGVMVPAALVRDQEELDLFREVAADLALALYKMDIEDRERRSRAALEESLSLYRATLDATADGLLVVDREGRIVSFNRKFVEMWDIPEDIMESRDDDRALEFVLDQVADPQGFLGKVRDLYSQPELESFDRLYFKDGRVFERYSSPQYLDDQIVGRVWSFRDVTARVRAEEDVKKYQSHLEDLVKERTAALIATNAELNREISEHKQTETALRESEARFRAIFEGAPIGISLQDQTGTVLAVNPTLTKILGCAPGEYDLGASLYPEDRQAFLILCQDLAEGRRDHFVLEHRVFHQDGHLVWLRVHLSKIKGTDDQPWFTLSLIEDITRERESQAEISAYQERLRAMAAQLSMTEERERRRLAADLHDNIGQMLALLQIKLGSLRQGLSSPLALQDLDEARSFLAQIIQTTRSLTLEMGLSVLHELGFESGVEWLGEKFQEQYGLQVEVECDPLPTTLGSLHKTLFFRVIRELLTNVVKHAQATSARVSVQAEGGRFCLRVVDDGLGFEMSSLNSLTGFGLFSIAERISNQGGKMEIHSNPGEGTEVIITLPLGADPPMPS